MLTLPRRLTYEDYRRIPDDGQRYEIIDGEVYVSPSPALEHQHASAALHLQLAEALPGSMRVYYAPIDVVLGVHDVVQPDLVVAGLPQLSSRGIEGPPHLVIEIVSPGRPEYDRTVKARRYAAFGVPHYWIVDPRARTLECFVLAGDSYGLVVSGQREDAVEVPGFESLTLALTPLWIDLPAR
jgi:Uma2 family endonuclease